MPVRSKSAKKPSPLDLAKSEAASKQLEIEQLTEEVGRLKQELELKSNEVLRLRKKLLTILPEILSHRDREKFPLEPVDDPAGRLGLYYDLCPPLFRFSHPLLDFLSPPPSHSLLFVYIPPTQFSS